MPCSISLSILLKQVLSLNVEMVGDHQTPERLFLLPTMLWSQLFWPQPSVYMFAEDLNSCLRACITSHFICCSISQAPTEILVITLLGTDLGRDACSLFQWRYDGVRTGSFGGRRGTVILQTVVSRANATGFHNEVKAGLERKLAVSIDTPGIYNVRRTEWP